MSTPLAAPTLFAATLKFYLARLFAVPSGANFVATVQSTLRDLLSDSSLVVQSADCTVGPAQFLQGGTTYVPVLVRARFTSQKLATREEWVRALARAFMQTHTLSGRVMAGDTSPAPLMGPATAAINNGADIVTAALDPGGIYGRVKIDPITVMVRPATVTPTAPQTVTQTDPATRERVTTTLTPVAGTETVQQTVVRTNPSTGHSTTSTTIIPKVDASLQPDGRPPENAIENPSGFKFTVPMALGAAALAGLAYYVVTRKGRRSVHLRGASTHG